MLKSSFKIILIMLFSLAISSNLALSDEQASKKSAPRVVLTGKVDMLANVCAGSGITIESRQLPTVVLDVRRGSPAFYAGVAQGDKVINAKLDGNKFKLLIKRKGKTYLVAMRATLAKKEKPRVLQGAVKQLSDYHVILLVDRSGSMTRDLGNSGHSRWYWISKEVKSLSRELENRYRATLDLGLFSQQYLFSKNLNAEQVKNAIENTVTTGHTDLAPPLEAALNSYFQSKPDKPLLLLVFTDGITVNKDRVRGVLKNAERKLQADSGLKVVLFQTGFSEEGSRFLSSLRTRQIKVQLFEKLTRTGLIEGVKEIIQ